MTTQLQIRIDAKTKKEAQRIFKEMGLDMSSGIKMFLQRVVNTESIPFSVVTKNGFTKEQEQVFISETKQAIKSGKRYTTVDALMTDLEQ